VLVDAPAEHHGVVDADDAQRTGCLRKRPLGRAHADRIGRDVRADESASQIRTKLVDDAIVRDGPNHVTKRGVRAGRRRRSPDDRVERGAAASARQAKLDLESPQRQDGPEYRHDRSGHARWKYTGRSG
jgi:hypothetical protein